MVNSFPFWFNHINHSNYKISKVKYQKLKLLIWNFLFSWNQWLVQLKLHYYLFCHFWPTRKMNSNIIDGQQCNQLMHWSSDMKENSGNSRSWIGNNDIGDIVMLMTYSWWRFFDVGDQNPTTWPANWPAQYVSNICHQHRCNPWIVLLYQYWNTL